MTINRAKRSQQYWRGFRDGKAEAILIKEKEQEHFSKEVNKLEEYLKTCKKELDERSGHLKNALSDNGSLRKKIELIYSRSNEPKEVKKKTMLERFLKYFTGNN